MGNKKLLLFAFLLLLFALPAKAMQSAQGWCESGDVNVITGGLTSTTQVQASYPSCTVTVFLYGTGTLAPIYSSNSLSTPLANPFTANLNGQWQFYAPNGHYSVQTTFTQVGAPPAVSYLDILLSDTGQQLITANIDGIIYLDGIVYTTLNAAVQALGPNGGEVIVPPTSTPYVLTATVNVATNGTKIICAGSASDTQNPNPNGACRFNVVANTTAMNITAPHADIEGLQFVSADTAAGSDDCILVAAPHVRLINNTCQGFGADGFDLDSSVGFLDTDYFYLEHNVADTNFGNGIHLAGGVFNNAGTGINNFMTHNGGYGLRVDFGVANTWIGGSAQTNGTGGYYLDQALGNTFIAVFCEATPVSSFILTSNSANNKISFTTGQCQNTLDSGFQNELSYYVGGLLTLSGNHVYSGNETFSGSNTFNGPGVYSNVNNFTGQILCHNLDNIRCVDQANSASWAGSDVGGWINSAYADLPSSGGYIRLAGAPSCYSQQTQVVFNTPNKPAMLVGDGTSASCLNYTPTSGSAILLDWGTGERVGYGVRDVYLTGGGSGNATTGIQLGAINGAELALLDNVKVELFGTGVSDAFASSFLVTIRDSVISANHKNISITTPVENFRIEHSVISNFSNANQPGCITISNGDVNISDTSLDSCQLSVSGLAIVAMNGGHMENPNSDPYDFVSFTGANSLRMQGVFMLQDLTAAPNPEQISINGNGTFVWSDGHYFSGALQTNFIKIVGGNPNIYTYGSTDSSSAYTGGWLGGSTTGRYVLAPSPATGITAFGPAQTQTNTLVIGTGFALTGSGQGGIVASQGADINSVNQVTSTHLIGPSAPGGAMRWQITDFGQLTLSSGTVTHALGSTYTGAPICFSSWTGGGTLAGQLKTTSSTTTVTITSTTGSDTAQVNWFCMGN